MGKCDKEGRRKTWRVLFSCVGRRVALIESFRRAGEALGMDLVVHGTDATGFSPALQRVDHAHRVAPIAEGRYIDELCGIVKRRKIDLLIPLIDSELSLLASAVDRLAELGCTALVSSPEVIDTCGDKIAWYERLREAGIETPRTWSLAEALARKRHKFPLFMKPRFGSAAKDNFIVRNRRELEVFGACVKEPVVQELIEGPEYTLDVYTGFDGRPRCVVPRRRLEVRAGEVTKALVVKDRAIMAVGRQVVEMLGSCRGVVTVQCIDGGAGRIRVIEVNPRFGGGVPLAIHAGADFPKWILTELAGDRPHINPNAFADDVAMLRYDESVFVRHASRGAARRRSGRADE